jgi:hypothetical protein
VASGYIRIDPHGLEIIPYILFDFGSKFAKILEKENESWEGRGEHQLVSFGEKKMKGVEKKEKGKGNIEKGKKYF